jgi:hypothetical protein
MASADKTSQALDMQYKWELGASIHPRRPRQGFGLDALGAS